MFSVAPQGVTGADDSADALREIHDAYAQHDLFVPVIAEEASRVNKEGRELLWATGIRD